MKTLVAIVEDANGNVIGAHVQDETGLASEIKVPPFPRAQLASMARDLATVHGIQLPADNAALPPDDKQA